MRLNLVTPCAAGLALVVSLGGASLHAQQPAQADQRVQVQKDRVVQEAPGVIEAQVSGIELRTDMQTINVGQNTQLQAEVRSADGQVLYGRQVTYRSENPEVATVSQDGRVTAVSPGTATIVAEVNGQQQRTTITVRQADGMMQQTPRDTARTDQMPQDTTRRTDQWPQDTTPRTDTTEVDMGVIEPEPVEETVVVEEPADPWPPVMRRGAFYWGVAGGANFPQGTLSDTYNTGFNVTVPIGWDPVDNPWGVRADLAFNQLGGRTFAAGATQLSTDNAQVWSASLNGTLRLPIMTGEGRSGPYAVAGVGMHHLRNFTAVMSDPMNGGIGDFETENTTRFGWNAGGGFAFGVGGASLFVEGRYVSVDTPGERLNYVPVVLGITF